MNLQHPKLICSGMPVKTMHLILNNVGERVKQGKKNADLLTY